MTVIVSELGSCSHWATGSKLTLPCHTTWIPQSLDIIPRSCDIALVVQYCPSTLGINIFLCLQNLVRIIVRPVEFVKKPVEKLWSKLQEGSVQTITGILWGVLCYLVSQNSPLLACCSRHIFTVYSQVALGQKPKLLWYALNDMPFKL